MTLWLELSPNRLWPHRLAQSEYARLRAEYPYIPDSILWKGGYWRHHRKRVRLRRLRELNAAWQWAAAVRPVAVPCALLASDDATLTVRAL